MACPCSCHSCTNAQVEQLQKVDAEGRERLSTNLALITDLEREVAHWRSRTVLADREWSERHQSLTAERAGMQHALSTLCIALIRATWKQGKAIRDAV